MHAVELDFPTPRPVRRRWGNPTWHAGFNPWLTWKTGCQCVAGGALAGGVGWPVSLFFPALGMAFLIFGALVGALGLWCSTGGLFVANEELRGHRFLVEKGIVATAHVVPHEEMRYEPVFEFRDARGRVRRGRCSMRRADEWFENMGVGGEFDVLYSPRNSRHFVPYAIAIYEVAI